MSKKAQAAVEFLTTYGWAILMIGVIVGAFAYLGFTDPTRFINDKCVASPGFHCSEIGLIEDTNSGQIYIGAFIQNVGENDVEVTDWISNIDEDSTFSGDCSTNNPKIGIPTATPNEYQLFDIDAKIQKDKQTLIVFDCPELQRGQTFKIEYRIPYRELRTRFTNYLEGEIVIKGSNTFEQYQFS